MKYYLFITALLLFFKTNAQPFFPIRVNGLWGAIDSSGRVVLEPSYKGHMHSMGEKNEFLINRNSDTITIINSRMQIAKTISSGFFDYLGHGLFRFTKDSTRLIELEGIMDTTGKIIIAPKFDLIHSFNDGLALVKYKGKAGIIDTLGNFVIPPIYGGKALKEYGEGIIRFWETEKGWGAMDKTGKVVIQPKYSYLGPCMNGYMEYSLTDFYWKNGLMTKDEKIIIRDEGKSHIEYRPCSETDTLLVISRVKGNDVWNAKTYDNSVYTIKGHKLFEIKVEELQGECYGVFQIRDKNKNSGLINSKGQEIAPTQYPVMLTRKSPLIQVQDLNNLWGFMDYNGKMVIPCTYSDSSPFDKGIAAVYMGGSKYDYGYKPEVIMGYVNTKGVLIWPLTK